MGECVPAVNTRSSRKQGSSKKGDYVTNKTVEDNNSNGTEDESVENVKEVADTDLDREVSALDDGEKTLQPSYFDQKNLSEQDDDKGKGKEKGSNDKDTERSKKMFDSVPHMVTQECEHTVEEEKHQALNSEDKNRLDTDAYCSEAEVEEENIVIGTTDAHKRRCEINTCSKTATHIDPWIDITEESDDDIPGFIFIGEDKIHVEDVFIELCCMLRYFFFHNKLYFAVYQAALMDEPFAVPNNRIAITHPHLAWIINNEYMHLLLQEGHIVPDCQINAAVMGTKTCIFCTDSSVTYEFPSSSILALYLRRCMMGTSYLNAVKTLSLRHRSRELLDIEAVIDLDDEEEICCVFCAEEVPVRNAGDLKKGQHLTRPGQSQSHQSWCLSGSCISFLLSCISFLLSCVSLVYPVYRHHLLLENVVSYPDQTAMLTLIHRTKIGKQNDIFETVESCNVPDEDLCVVKYRCPKYSCEAIIHRAKSRLNFCREVKLNSYNPFKNNCEHTITEIVVGTKISLQTRNFTIVLANILMFIFFIVSWFMSGSIKSLTATFVAFCIYCISFILLAVDLNTYCKKAKIICGSCLKDNRVKIWLQVFLWTLLLLYLMQACAFQTPVLTLGCITCGIISSF